MILRRFFALVVASPLVLAAAVLVMLNAAPLAAQEVVQDEGAAYRAWHEASQAGDIAKAIDAAKAYLEKYPEGQYVDFLTKWLPPARMALLDAAIKEKREADMIKIGREVLASDPENVNVLYALAVNASPANGVEFAKKAISLVEAGKTMANVPNFDKNGTLALLTRVLAEAAKQAGNTEEAAQLYEKSSQLAPLAAARNLLALITIRQTAYVEAAEAFNALPEADRSAAEPTPEVQAVKDGLDSAGDALIDVTARFVALATVRNLSASARNQVNQTLEAAYKVRHPEDAELTGLQTMLQEKQAALGAAPTAPNN